MIDFWLIRHGETEENIKKVCQGQTPGTLTADGLMQAEKAAEALKEIKFDSFYSSDLLRTMKSAEAIAQHQKKLEVIPTQLLRERYLASMQGKPFPNNWNWEESQLPEGAETFNDLIKRVEEFIALICKNNDGERVLAMSHGGLIRAFWTVLEKQAPESYYQWDAPRNTSISRFRINGVGNYETISMNNTDHLGDFIDKNTSAWQL